jgi:hypothetical protein
MLTGNFFVDTISLLSLLLVKEETLYTRFEDSLVKSGLITASYWCLGNIFLDQGGSAEKAERAKRATHLQ